jgi:hypothetical protein
MGKSQRIKERRLANQSEGQNKRIAYLEVENLKPFEDYPIPIDPADEATLEKSIREEGTINTPLHVVNNGDRTYIVLAGINRLRIAKKLKFQKLPCQIKEIPESEWKNYVIDDNLARRQLEIDTWARLYLERWGEEPPKRLNQPRDERGRFTENKPSTVGAKCSDGGEPDPDKQKKALRHLERANKKLLSRGEKLPKTPGAILDRYNQIKQEERAARTKEQRKREKEQGFKQKDKLGAGPGHEQGLSNEEKTVFNILFVTLESYVFDWLKNKNCPHNVVIHVLESLLEKYRTVDGLEEQEASGRTA